jgi:hypothetical protein
MIDDIRRVVNAAALITGAMPTVTWGLIFSERYPNSVMGRVFTQNMALLGETMLPAPAGMAVGSSDFSNVSMIIPGIHEYIAIAPLEVKTHTMEFAEAAASPRSDEMLLKGAQGLAMTAYDILTDQSLRTEINEEFHAKVPASK